MRNIIGTIIGGIFLLLFVLFLYLNNGQVIIRYHNVEGIISFDCSDNQQYLSYHFFNDGMSYVIKSSKDGKAVDMAKYDYQIVLGRDLGGGFWQFPKPYFITPIFSTRKLDDDEMAAKIEYKLINKVGYGLSDSTFGSIGSHGYKKIIFSDRHLKINGITCPATIIHPVQLDLIANL